MNSLAVENAIFQGDLQKEWLVSAASNIDWSATHSDDRQRVLSADIASSSYSPLLNATTNQFDTLWHNWREIIGKMPAIDINYDRDMINSLLEQQSHIFYIATYWSDVSRREWQPFPEEKVLTEVYLIYDTIIDTNLPSWYHDLEKKFEELTTLQFGWDGYRGRPVSEDNANLAEKIIKQFCLKTSKAPQLVPVSDGTLQIEWHFNNYDLEIHISTLNNIVATRTDIVTDKEEDIEVKTDFRKLKEWIIALDEDRTAHQGSGG